ncbi:MAG TPA: hypothetical protein VF345_00050 [Chthoniobacterales bacterium]
MNTTETFMLVQAAIMLGTAAVVVWYTVETRRLRATAAAQFEIMRRTYGIQLEEMKRAAEPIFVWGGGSATENHVEWHFMNEGGPISRLTITIPSETGKDLGIKAEVRPHEWLGNSREGAVMFDGNVGGQFRFHIGFQTRIGGVGAFFFLASSTSKRIYTGSGWM